MLPQLEACGIDFFALLVGKMVAKINKNRLTDTCKAVLSDSGGIRTHAPQLRRLLLYPTELRNHRVSTSSEAICDAKITYLFLLSKLNDHFPSVCCLDKSYLRLRIRLNGSFITPNSASLNMPPLIFDAPSRRSVKTIDTSPSLRPNRHAVYFISIWKP